MEAVLLYLKANKSITNAQLRALTKLNYDQAIKFFSLAVVRGMLDRRGHASGTNYVMKDSGDEESS